MGKNAPVSYEKEIVVEVQTVDALEARIKSAKEAKSAEIEALAQEAYNTKKREEELKVEQSVTSEYRKELEAKEAELEEQLSF